MNQIWNGHSMDLHYLLILTFLIGFLLLLIQRAEPKSRRLVIALTIIPGIFIRNFIRYRDIETEGWVALLLALLLNFLFWVLIGRYNPVPSSDDIRVLGLDD
jgi:hypothetical protein